MKTLCSPWKKDSIDPILATLKAGGVVIYPTETSYGIGVDATQEAAVQKIYTVKGRDARKSVLCIVDSLAMAKRYCTLSPAETRVVTHLMPGPLTLVACTKGKKIRVSENKTFAFRIPTHPVAHALVHAYKKPITSTSANRSGKEPLYRIADIIKEFFGKVDLIIDGGDLDVKKPSTVVQITDSVQVFRNGPVSKKRIEAVAFPHRRSKSRVA